MVIWSFFSLVLTPSGFPAWCWLQAKPRYRLPGHMPTPKLYPLFFHYFNFVLVVLRQFWYQSKHRSIWSEASRSQSKNRKNHHKKKKKKKSLSIVFSPPESCLCHFFYLVQESFHSVVFPSTKKKKETHARPITHKPPKPIKSTPTATDPNNHQPQATAKPNTSPHSPAAKTQNPNTSPSTTTDAKARDEQPPLLHASCRRCLPVFTPPPGVGLQRRPRTFIAETASISNLISFESC